MGLQHNLVVLQFGAHIEGLVVDEMGHNQVCHVNQGRPAGRMVEKSPAWKLSLVLLCAVNAIGHF